MLELNHRMTRLEPESELGSLVLGSLERQVENLGDSIGNPELWRIHGGTHNATVLAQNTENGYRVMCRRPLHNIRRDTALYRERQVHQMLPDGVSPQSYALDEHDPDRPIHILQYIEGVTLPYDKWSETTLLSFANKLARAHAPLEQQPTNLLAYLMRYNFESRIDAIQTPHNIQLSQEVLAATKAVATRAQPLFSKPETVLAHHDLQASNIIIDRTEEVWLWDWEYGGPLHPDLELGAVCYPGSGLNSSRMNPHEKSEATPANPHAISSEMLELNERQELAFIEAYESVAGKSPARHERIRTSQCINMARIVIALTAKEESYPPAARHMN